MMLNGYHYQSIVNLLNISTQIAFGLVLISLIFNCCPHSPISDFIIYPTSPIFWVLKTESKMEGFAVNTIVASVISWTALFLLSRKLLRSRSFEFCNRIVSTWHATLAVILASLSVQDWNCPLASQSAPYQMKIIAISLGYFIYDMICSQFSQRPNLDNSIHHLVCIIGLGAGLVYQKCGSEMVAALWITEMSSPFLHLRELLKELGYKDTDLNLAADVAFAVIFSIARMVGGPYLTYVTLSASNPFLIKATALGLQLVSTFWFYKIARMIQYKLIKRASAVKKIT